MRVLICGGGIAGLTLAYWLRRYGVEPVVIEQAPSLRREGYAIDFFGAGYDVAERMGLIDQLASRQIRMDAISYVDHAGRPEVSIDWALLQNITKGKYFALMHTTLEEMLFNALGGQVEVRCGCSLTAVHNRDAAVDVTLSDGTIASYDLLIGADGAHSLVRELVFGPETTFSHFLGYMVACYPLPDHYGVGSHWKVYATPGRLVGAYPSEQAGEIITLLLNRQAQPERVAPERRLSWLRATFAGVGWIAPQLLAEAPDNGSIFLDAVSQMRMPSWSKGRVALVGDACDCPTLVSGQGASLAMGGAYLLARELAQTSAYQDAFRQYEAQLRPTVRSQQQRSRGLARAMAPATQIGTLAQRALLKIVLRKSFLPLLRREFGAESFLPPDELAPSQQAGA
jgi:2-polyprenyl-6-methoxyphenol hydroxylase-like FAD-dependent oxidoreductase